MPESLLTVWMHWTHGQYRIGRWWWTRGLHGWMGTLAGQGNTDEACLRWLKGWGVRGPIKILSSLWNYTGYFILAVVWTNKQTKNVVTISRVYTLFHGTSHSFVASSKFEKKQKQQQQTNKQTKQNNNNKTLSWALIYINMKKSANTSYASCTMTSGCIKELWYQFYL